MAVRKPKPTGERVINLDGPAGNAFAIMGIVDDFLYQLGKTDDEIRIIRNEMMAGDYHHLLTVANREIGSFVTWETGQEDLIELLS